MFKRFSIILHFKEDCSFDSVIFKLQTTPEYFNITDSTDNYFASRVVFSCNKHEVVYHLIKCLNNQYHKSIFEKIYFDPIIILKNIYEVHS